MLVWLVWVGAPVHRERGEVERIGHCGLDHRSDDVNDPAMAEAVNGHQTGFVFGLERSPFYREADEYSGRTPTILYLEQIGPVLEVVVQAYVLCVMDVPRGSGKCVRFSGDAAVQEL